MHELYSAKILFEVIDGEVIIISQESGVYYSLQGQAAAVWQLVVNGFDSSSENIDLLISRCIDNRSTREKVIEFLNLLVNENLLRKKESRTTPFAAQDQQNLIDQFCSSSSESLVIERFENMVEYLNVDPIHEVTSAGWPFNNRTPESN